MPWFKKGPYDKTLVFDAFVAVNRQDAVAISWNVDLNPTQRDKLATLLSLLGHLGRAESWCEATLEEVNPIGSNCHPIGENEVGPEWEILSVLCPDGESAFQSNHLPSETTSRKQSRATPKKPGRYDPAWNLCLDTADLQKAAWSDPPGSRWIKYIRPTDAFLPRKAESKKSSPAKPTLARYLLDSTVRPLVASTLAIAEKCRWALMGKFRELEENRMGIPRKSSLPGQNSSVIFSGKSSDGTPLSGHSHATYMPLDLDGDGRIDEVWVHAPGGFDPQECRALKHFDWIPTDSGHPIKLVLLALDTDPVTEVSQVWSSATPYLSTRFPKKNGKKKDPPDFFLPGGEIPLMISDIKRQIAHRGWPQPISIQPILDSQGIFRLPQNGRLGLRPIQFLTRRRKEVRSVKRVAGFFRLEWATPLPGPVCLGHSSHFGMGLFRPGD